jgi:hypothetical protein
VAVWTTSQTAQFLASIDGHRLCAAYHLIGLRDQHTYGIPAAQAPVFRLEKTPGGEMVTLYRESFERVWARSTPLG